MLEVLCAFAKCEAAGKRINTYKSEVIVLRWKKSAQTSCCAKWRSLSISSERRGQWDTDGWTGAVVAVIRTLYWSGITKRES